MQNKQYVGQGASSIVHRIPERGVVAKSMRPGKKESHREYVESTYKTQHRMSRALRVMPKPKQRLQKILGHFPFLKVYGLEGGELIMKDLGDTDLFALKESGYTRDLKSIHDQLMGALVFMLQNEIVHRDIKLENIMASYTGPGKKQLVLTLIDFADACHKRDAEKCIKRTCGTVDYLSPEYFVKGRHQNWEDMVLSDLWAMGIVLYEVLFGETPHEVHPAMMRPSRFYSMLYNKKGWPQDDVFSEKHIPMHTLTDASKAFLPTYLNTVKSLLSVDPKKRLSFIKSYAKQYYPPIVPPRTRSSSSSTRKSNPPPRRAASI